MAALTEDEKRVVADAKSLLPSGDSKRYPTVRGLLAIIDRLTSEREIHQ